MTAFALSKKPVEISMAAVITGAIWLSCLTIGLVGVVIPHERAQRAKAVAALLQAELINVQLSNDPLPPIETAPPPLNALIPPPLANTLPPPSAPALTPVAAANAPVAFALPVTGPTQVVDAKQANYAQPEVTPVVNSASQVPVRTLTFGSGEGKQPAPRYPGRALSEGQEGTVRVIFTVGADGRTIAAELSASSPWPLLNEEALRVIREKWRFAAGPIRRFEVPINFKIRK